MDAPHESRAPKRRAPISLDSRLFLALLVLLGATAVFWVARWIHAERPLNFLIWNLFLAVIPVAAAWGARRVGQRGWFWLLALVWLAFFPNAPYIVTDLMHIRTTRPGNLWVDVLVLGSSALTGLAAGLVSLRWIHEALLRRARPAVGWLFVAAVGLLAGFGVYLGRFQRWNSWDIVARPTELLAEAWAALAETHVLAFSVLVSGVILGGYAAMTLVIGAPRPLSAPGTSPAP